jgi:serine/threonine protein kinase
MDEPFICPYCGKAHRRTAKYCPSTGKLIDSTSRQEQAVASPTPPAAGSQAGTTGNLGQNAIIHNRYRILKSIGKGGMAAVYQVADIHLQGKVWAVKEMSESWITEPAERLQAIQAFQQEALLLARLNHPNLPRVIDTFSEVGKHYLVMEFVYGQTLEAILKDRLSPFSEQEVMPWALQLCDVLHYLHSQPKPIIFRDLKPSNIMIDQSGQVKLIDFGIVRFFKPGQAKDTMAFGTQGYCAIEALSGQTDARSDLYSLCVVLHEMLTRHDPATTMFRLPPIRRINPHISPEWERIIQRGLESDRNLRWPDLKTFSEALSRVRPPQQEFINMPATVAVPVVADQKTIQAEPLPVRKTSRPTVRLVAAMTRLSAGQLAAVIGIAIVVVVAALWLLTPILVNYPLIWNNIPIISLVAPLAYAALPRRWLPSIVHACFAVIGGATIHFRLEMAENHLLKLLLGAVLSAALIEILLRNMDRIRGSQGEEAWRRELAWLCGMSVVATALLYEVTFGRGSNLWLWLGAAVMAGVGWFVGDMIKEYLKVRHLH